MSLAAVLELVRRHWRFFRRARVLKFREVALVAALSVAAIAAEAGGLGMILPIVGFIEAGRDPEAFAASSGLANAIVHLFGRFGIATSLLTLSAAALVLILIRQTTNYFNTVEVERVKWSIGKRLSVVFFESILGSKSSNIRSFKPGQFSQIADYECQASAAIIRVYAAILQQWLSFLAYSAVLVAASPSASVVAGCLVIVSAFFLRYLVRKIKSISLTGIEMRRLQVDFLNERFRAWKLIKLGNTLSDEAARMGQLASQIAENQVRMTRVNGLLTLAFVPTMSALTLGMLYLFVEVLDLPLATVVLFTLVLVRLIPVSQALQKQVTLLAQYTPSLELLDDAIMRAKVEEENLDNGQEFRGLRRSIRFVDVSFSYPGRDAPALAHLDFEISANSLVAVVGASGAGKSTLVDLLPRFIAPDTGKILIDDLESGRYSLRSLRREIGYVPQEPFLFDASVSENIRYLCPRATDAEVAEVASLANAHEFIAALPEGYATKIGDGGNRLSGGQKQRIVLARAFLARSSVLILDEPTSALDYESESAIQQSIESVVRRGGMTVIVIAHRLSTVRNADFVVHLDAGRIVRTGTAEEVLPSLSLPSLK